MNNYDFIREKIEFYCDADRRTRVMETRADEVRANSPTIADAIEAMKP